MSDSPFRTQRTIAVADHLWDVLALMSSEMGVDREGLINQALFAFARSNGYLLPGQLTPGPKVAMPGAVDVPAPTAVPSLHVAPVPSPVPVQMAPTPLPPPAVPSPVSAGPTVPLPADEEEPQPGSTVALKLRPGMLSQDPIDPLMPEPAAFDLGTRLTPDEISAARDRVLQQADELEREVQDDFAPDRGAGFGTPAPPEEPAPDVDSLFEGDEQEGTPQSPLESLEPQGPVLVLYAEDEEVDRVLGPRFLIGRGKHCDLIINSGKVSREHAAIIREGDAYFVEDLGSSNGTWFDKKRITRRQVEDGDEYYVCSEKITCRLL